MNSNKLEMFKCESLRINMFQTNRRKISKFSRYKQHAPVAQISSQENTDSALLHEERYRYPKKDDNGNVEMVVTHEKRQRGFIALTRAVSFQDTRISGEA